MSDAYPYTETFSALIEPIELSRTKHRAQEVVSARGVSNPQGALMGYAGTTLDGARGDSELVLDFGRLVVGHAALQITVLAEAEIELLYGETADEALRREDFVAEWYTLPVDRYSRGLGPWVVRSEGRRAFRYLTVRVPEGAGQVRIESVWGEHAAYPVARRGAFSCSDPALNAIWRMSQRTLANTMQRYYEDGSKRDGLLWISEYRVAHLANAMAFGDTTLAHNSLLMIAGSQRADGALPACAAKGGGHQHPERIGYMPGMPHGSVDGWVQVNQCCDFISALKEYVIYSGDRQLLATLFPTLTRLLRWLTVDLDLASQEPGRNFVTDRQPDARDGWWCSRGVLAMQLYWALSDAALMGSWLKVDDVTSNCVTTASLLRRYCQRHYWDGARGVYLDARGQARTSQHVNAMALLSGITRDEVAGDHLMHAVDELDDARYPLTGQMQFWCLASKWAARRADVALDTVRGFWGAMRAQGATTCWESVDVRNPAWRPERYPISYCHGSSAGPLYLLPRFVLGVQPAGLGYEQVRVSPQLGDLDWAEGSVPTPLGDIHVRWEARPALHGWITLPKGIEGSVLITVEGLREGRALTQTLHAGENRVG